MGAHLNLQGIRKPTRGPLVLSPDKTVLQCQPEALAEGFRFYKKLKALDSSLAAQNDIHMIFALRHSLRSGGEYLRSHQKRQNRVDISFYLEIADFRHTQPGDVSLQRVRVVARHKSHADIELSGEVFLLRFIESPQ